MTQETPFKDVNEIEKSRGLKVLVYGKPATGKTFFALTFPNPLYVVDSERAVTLFKAKFKEKTINIVEAYEKNPVEGERDDVKVYERIVGAVDYLYNNKIEGGTIVIDSLSDFWKVCQNYAKIKIFKIKKEDRLKYQFDWGVINDLYNDVIKKLLHLNMNVVLTARASQDYDSSGKALNEYSPNCQKDTEYYMDVVLEMRKVFRNKQAIMTATMQKCRNKGELIGKEYEFLTYDKLQQELM